MAKKKQADPLLWTQKEVAEHFGVTPTTVLNHVNKGALASVSVGQSRHVPESEVRRYEREGIWT